MIPESKADPIPQQQNTEVKHPRPIQHLSPEYQVPQVSRIEELPQERQSLSRHVLSEAKLSHRSIHQSEATQRNQIGRWVYADGSVYEGEVRNNKRHGKGVLTFINHAVYEGEWFDGQMQGYGCLNYPDGRLGYQGSFWKDQFHGKGILYNETPAEGFDGPFNYEDFTQLGDNWTMYDGEFEYDKKHGKGILSLVNGEKYEGEFANDTVHGRGTFLTKNNEIIHGIWIKGKLMKIISSRKMGKPGSKFS